MSDILEQLSEVLEQRKQMSGDNSYVSELYEKGLNKILEKIGEEATETILAAKDAQSSQSLDDVIGETADLWFHSMVMLAYLGTGPDAVLAELQCRFGLSGLDEKAARQQAPYSGKNGHE